MFRRFTYPDIFRPFTLYCDDYHDGKTRAKKFVEIQFSGMWANCFSGEDNRDNFFPLESVVKITYTYYDWLKKKRVNQTIYKRNKK